MNKSAITERLLFFRLSREGLRLVLFGTLLVLGMAVLLAQTSLVASTGYNLERLQELRDSRQRENQRLEEEVAHLRSLDRIENEARKRLKMVTPTSYIYLSVDTFPKDPTPLLKKALRTNHTSASAKPRPWWETLARVFFAGRSES